MISVSDLPFCHPVSFCIHPETSQINTLSAEKGREQHSERLQYQWEPFAFSQHIRCVVLLTDVIQILNQKPGFSPPTTLYSLNIIKQ